MSKSWSESQDIQLRISYPFSTRTYACIQVSPDNFVVHLVRIIEIRKFGFPRERELLKPVKKFILLSEPKVRVLRSVLKTDQRI